MKVIIKPIIKPVGNPTLNFREFDDVESISSTMNHNYILIHKDGLTKVEFHLPDDCYLIQQPDEQDRQIDVEEVFKVLDAYLKGIDKSHVPSVLETLICNYTTHANVDIEWIEIC